ncbi:bifunctional PTS fructose transporter subunit IIA/HPr protein [Photobacterium proteolyticum]|uniref:Multiphosphoryl transfer protein n=1 Tax=Photobacterium proteolyticum TaxID=1903952 RepID=A0A1Q9GJ56_9GAMM|nr:fused PTS fructose transporter subunit IIA/HPr protein [Photobacterium proteolyticum]OLQ74496.1 bifunctional PTS fructose transporter subunit IIA/HPr protein [Photobacterium proteolyticum]
MLSLSKSDIQLKQSAADKQQAIKALATGLEQQGLVDTGYVNGMLDREAQNSTFLGNGIAIPHGTTDTRGLVKQTGVRVHHFPQGVDWGEGKTAYLAIGIAAKSDEHLGILKQLTKVLSADGVEEKLKHCDSAEGLIAILNGDEQLEAEFDAGLVQLAFPATDLIQLTAVAAGLIKNRQAAGNTSVADAIATGANYLGQGLWLAKTDKEVTKTALSFVTPATEFDEQGRQVKGLLMVAACNGAHLNNMNYLAQLLYKQQADKLFTADEEKVVSLLTQEVIEGNSDVFKIRNPHGLHARPGAMLVSVAKKFESNILVANLNGDGKAVNAKSLMKVIALGVKQGHELQFTAQGDDAEAALAAIGQAIADGLGEGK